MLAQAAEGCASPVRLGISKPLGASSVVADYQTSPRSYNSNYISRAAINRLAGRQGQSIVRQLHVRAARVTASSATRTRFVRIRNVVTCLLEMLYASSVAMAIPRSSKGIQGSELLPLHT